MKLLPWSGAEAAVDAAESAPSAETLGRARSEIDGLARYRAVPGVEGRAAELARRLAKIRARAFDAAYDAGDLASAAAIRGAVPAPGRDDEETIRIAILSRRAGAPAPSLARFTEGAVPAELRAAFFAARTAEAEEAGEPPAALRELLSSWIRHDRADPAPWERIVRVEIAQEAWDRAAQALSSMGPALAPRIREGVAHDATIPLARRALFFLQTGDTARGLGLLDRVLEAAPDDAWALEYRARWAESLGEPEVARRLYARILAGDPARIDLARRAADLAAMGGDEAEALARYEEAFRGGDHEAGILRARILLLTDPAGAAEAARAVLAAAPDADRKAQAAGVLLEAGAHDDAARAFREVLRISQAHADEVLKVVHARVTAAPRERLELLQLLADVAPLCGYPSDAYLFLKIDDLVAAGRAAEAKDVLGRMLQSDSRWKAMARLAELALAGPRAEQEVMARRIESGLAEAERAGKSAWADLAYQAARLYEAAGNRSAAVEKYERLVAKEFQYRDAAERLGRLLAAPAVDEAAAADDGKTVLLSAAQAQGRYELIAKLGEGGMGAVHKARDRKLDRLVALKVLSGGDAQYDLLVREARTCARLTHPNIVAVYDVGKEEGRWCIAMEYVEGPTLKAALEPGAFPRGDAKAVALALLGALDAAHAAGIIHRDLKPANVLLRGGARTAEAVKLADFGLARVSQDVSIVTPGMVAGTASYMSPEQIRGGAVDARADLYALGCVLYETLAGKPLFRGENASTTMFLHLHEEPGRLMENEVLADAALSKCLLGFLARDPALRYASAAEAARAVRESM